MCGEHVETAVSVDQVSSLTLFSCGTRVFWREGSQRYTIDKPSGGFDKYFGKGTNPVIQAMSLAAEKGFKPQRGMTQAEELEHPKMLCVQKRGA